MSLVYVSKDLGKGLKKCLYIDSKTIGIGMTDGSVVLVNDSTYEIIKKYENIFSFNMIMIENNLLVSAPINVKSRLISVIKINSDKTEFLLEKDNSLVVDRVDEDVFGFSQIDDFTYVLCSFREGYAYKIKIKI